MTDFDTPLYSLKMVVKSTGLTAATLRAWENRYGLPSPGRSAGRQRLYSRRDIQILRWLTARLAEGSRIRQAVDQWHAALAEGIDPLNGLPGMEPETSPAPAATLESLRQEWLEACRCFDEAASEQSLERALRLFPLEQACIQVLQAGLRQIGEEWSAGESTVQQEHFASAQALRRLESLFAGSPPPGRPQTVLVACPAGEWHTFAPLLLSLLLRRRGLHVIYLGASIPADKLAEAAREIRPNLVVLTAQTLPSAAGLLAAARLLEEMGQNTAFGGRVFTLVPGLSGRIPAHYLGGDLEAAALLADRLASGAQTDARSGGLPPTADPALETFKSKRRLIEMSVLRDPALSGLSAPVLEAANSTLGSYLQAALELGGIETLAPDLQWMPNLFGSAPGSGAPFQKYLQVYRLALREHLGEAGAAAAAWAEWDGASAPAPDPSTAGPLP